MLARIGIFALAAVVVLLILIATRPDRFRVERSIAIAAPAGVVYAHLADLRRWSGWNPFEKGDPTIVVTHGAASAGVGATYHYAGRRIGEGRMTIVDLAPGERVGVRGEFVRPMPAVHDIAFTIVPAGEGVVVTWSIAGQQTLLGKALSLVMSMDRMIGGEFEKGLADLKRIAEGEARAAVAAR